MLIEEVMSKNVITKNNESNLREIAEQMLHHRIGSIIVTDKDDIPVGIVTETDLIHAGYVADTNFSNIPTKRVMSEPLVTITKGQTLRRATELMNEKEIKRLPVLEQNKLIGIVTAHDIIASFSDLKSEIYEIARHGRSRVSGEHVDLDSF